MAQVKQLQIDELLKLQSLDNEIGELKSQLDALDRGERVERALSVRTGRLETARRRLQGLEIERRNSELELKTLEEKKHESSRKLYEGRITAPRELQALEMEVHSLERQRQRLDETILRRLDEIEAAKKAADTAQGAVDEAEKALRVVKKRYDKEASRIQKELDAILPEREKLAGQIQPDALRRYEEIRKRQHNIAAVRVQNGACGGCRMRVGTAMFRRMLTGEYVYCESCTRFLFPEE